MKSDALIVSALTNFFTRAVKSLNKESILSCLAMEAEKKANCSSKQFRLHILSAFQITNNHFDGLTPFVATTLQNVKH
jgi:hypothetical protein